MSVGPKRAIEKLKKVPPWVSSLRWHNYYKQTCLIPSCPLEKLLATSKVSLCLVYEKNALLLSTKTLLRTELLSSLSWLSTFPCSVDDHN